MQFSNQIAIVTGAGQGIGFEAAKQLALRGAKVVLNDLDYNLALSASQHINESAKAQVCHAVAGDTSNYAFIQDLVAQCVDQWGTLDILLANAGITLFGDFWTYPPDDFKKVLEVNLFGTFFLTQAAAKQMRIGGKGGRILFTSSVVGHQAHKHLAAYASTKSGLEMLAKNLVIELSPHGITVNTVAPGATLTERTLTDSDYLAVWSAITPTGRPAYVQDIVEAMLFMVSPQAGHITGQSLVVDGGWTAVSPPPAWGKLDLTW
jgi:glucose 1-dehydrogenase